MSNQAHPQSVLIPNHLTKGPLFLLCLSLWLASTSLVATDFENTLFDVHSSRRAEIAESAHNLEFDLPAPGILSVEILQRAGSQNPISLNLAQPETLQHAAILERSMNRMTLAVLSAGPLELRVSSQDLQSPLGGLHVVHHFVAAWTEQAIHRILPGSTTFWDGDAWATHTVLKPISTPSKTDLEEVDPNPGGLRFEATARQIEVLRIRGTEFSTKTDLEEVDPNPGGIRTDRNLQLTAAWIQEGPDLRAEVGTGNSETAWSSAYATLRLGTQLESPSDARDEMIELSLRLPWINFDQDPSAAIGQVVASTKRTLLDPKAALSTAISGLCKGREGSSFRCAASLEVGSRLEDQMGPHSDGELKVYSFDLLETMTLEIRADGDRHLTQTLFRESGERITSAEGHALKVVRSLAPGRYFLALEGPGQGDYEIATRRLR